LYLLSCIKPLDAFTSGAERLQSELVQTFPRPAPLIGSLSPSTMDFAQVQQGAVLIVNGSQFVSSSVVVVNGKTLSTTVTSSQQLKVAITTGLISGPGAVNVSVQTPGGNSGDLGCASGGNSSALVLTIT
jgi:hypothetical protein